MSLKELQRWARTAELAAPIDWAAVEARIDAEPAPEPEELAQVAANAPGGGAGTTILRSLVLAPVVVPTLGLPVVGLGFVLAYVLFDMELPADWGIVVQICFAAAILLALFTVYMWLESRRRGWENVGLSGLIALAAGASSLLLATTDETLLGVWPSVALMANIATAVALLACAFFLVFGTSAPQLTHDERKRAVTPEEHWLRNQRAVVLEQLVRRDLVNDADISTMISMPPGTWRQLQSQPDGRVVRTP